MKTSFLFLMLGLMLLVSSSPKGKFYQVITSDPHDLETLKPHIETAYQNGRLWVVKLNDFAPKNVLKFIRPLSGREKSYLHKIDPATRKVFLKMKDTIDITNQYIDTVDKELIKKDVEELSSYESRYTGTPENQEAVTKIEARFIEMGYVTKRICYIDDACGIIAEKKGKKSSSPVIMVIGHIDSVGESFAGADDNGSGIAVMLEMARNLKDYPNKKTIRFFVTNGEELGLLGSTHYARELERENKLKNLALVINMDMVGYNSNGIIELETNPEYENVAKWYAELALKYTSLKPKITLGAWGSDHVPFLERKVPSLLTLEDWDTKTPCYHQECDKPDTLNYNYTREIAKLNISAVIQKDLLPL